MAKKYLKAIFCNTTDRDFKLIVERTIAVFAVYTGATLTFYVKEFLFTADNVKNFGSLDWLSYWGTWAVVSVVALLLRYIVGSAVHLNSTYLPAANGVARSADLGWLFVDMFFLILFGLLAYFITSAVTIDEIIYRSLLFIGVGVAWSILAIGLRELDRDIAICWVIIDVAQFVALLATHYLADDPTFKAGILVVVNLICLYGDLNVMSKKNPFV